MRILSEKIWVAPAHLRDILNTEGVICVVGTGRSGKTCLGHLLAAESTKEVKVMAYPPNAINACPKNWSSVQPGEVFGLKDCVLIVDDAALWASARDFASSWSKAWIQFQTIVSHKAITIIFIVQSMNLLDIGTLRSQRMAVLYKMSDLVNVKYERDEFRSVAFTSRNHIIKIRKRLKDLHPKSFVYDMTMAKVWNHPIPGHWCDILSTPYRDYVVEVKQ